MSLSVVIPAHNAARWLTEALLSVRDQGLTPLPELVVVTDRCSDDSAAIARAAGARVLDSPAPGPAAARNAGIAACQGEFIAFLDADDLWPAGSLAPRLAALAADPDAAMIFGDCLQFEDDGRQPRMHAASLFEQAQLDAHFFGDAGHVRHALEKLLDAEFITTGSVIARRSCLLAHGGFDTRRVLVEDLDLWLRIAARQRILWHGGLALLRRRHDNNLSRDTQAMHAAYLDVLDGLEARPEGAAIRALIRRHRRNTLLGMAREACAHRRWTQALGHLLAAPWRP